MDADSVAVETHPVRLAVPSADELDDIFDTISYAKGSVICRMAADFGGKKFF
jgi:aminopeptidase N